MPPGGPLRGRAAAGHVDGMAAVDTAQQQQADADAAAEQLLDQLFAAFDQDHNGHLDFKEVAHMLKRLDPQHSLRSARNAATEALLVCDADSDRRLSKPEFYRLMHRLFKVAGVTSQHGAQRLLDSIASSPLELSPGDADVVQQPEQEPQPATGSAASTVHEQKLAALFGLWDVDGDGFVSFQELCRGLAKFRPIKTKEDVTTTFAEAARVLRQHDDAGDRRLCRAEFDWWIASFMSDAGYDDLHDVVDHLLVVAAKPGEDARLQRALDKAAPSIQQLLGTPQ